MNCLQSKVFSKVITLVISGCLMVLALGSCASNNSYGNSTKEASNNNSHIKTLDIKELVAENLASVLGNDRNIFELKVSEGQKRVTLSVDLLKDGKMQTVSSMEFPIDDKELNYLSISTDQLKTQEMISVALNGNKDSISLTDYFQDLEVQRTSVLGNERELEAVNYLMYITNQGEHIDLNSVYDEKILPKEKKLLVVKLELNQD